MAMTRSTQKGETLRNPRKSGVSDNFIAAIAYFGLPAFFFLAVRLYNKRPYVRFHSWQALVFDAFAFLFVSALEFVMPYLVFLGPRILLGLWCVVYFVIFLIWMWCVVGALSGMRRKLPVIGEWCDEQAYR
jgi:uncharacterized membrane protein